MAPLAIRRRWKTVLAPSNPSTRPHHPILGGSMQYATAKFSVFLKFNRRIFLH